MLLRICSQIQALRAMAALTASSVCSAFAPPAISAFKSKGKVTLCSLHRRNCIQNGNRPRLVGLRPGRIVRAIPDDMDDSMDDEGVVRDMERYLNDLSVEYENVWDTKPAWCQPWTIVLTGVTGVSLSWLLIKSAIVTGIVTILVAAWWYVFLYTYPMAYTAMIAERRRNQKNGTEDTYGLRTGK